MIVELREYILHPGQRDVLIELFDREFVETQEAVGMRVIGQFRDLDRPDRFVWLRGFADMPGRAAGLSAFYGGPVWKTHRDAANGTMIDSDNVLLLRAVLDPPAPAQRDTAGPGGLVLATIWSFAKPLEPGFSAALVGDLAPMLVAAGASLLGAFETEESPNNFPALPVRQGEHVFVWLAGFRDEEDCERGLAALEASPAWSAILARLQPGFSAIPQKLRLAPTSRSSLRSC